MNHPLGDYPSLWVLRIIRQVHEGGAPMSSSIARQVLRHFNQLGDEAPGLPQLSPREREVLGLRRRNPTAPLKPALAARA